MEALRWSSNSQLPASISPLMCYCAWITVNLTLSVAFHVFSKMKMDPEVRYLPGCTLITGRQLTLEQSCARQEASRTDGGLHHSSIAVGDGRGQIRPNSVNVATTLFRTTRTRTTLLAIPLQPHSTIFRRGSNNRPWNSFLRATSNSMPVGR